MLSLRRAIHMAMLASSDYFDPRLYAADQSTLEMTDQGRRNRMITVLWWVGGWLRG